MKRHLVIVLATAAALGAGGPASGADWRERLEGVTGTALKPAAGSSTAGLSTREMDGGLREALGVGAERAIRGLGRKGGYLDDPSVRIALPGKLKKLESTLRKLGKGDAVDEFTTTVNRAAEQAVLAAAPIVGDAVREMSIADARHILTGPDDAATAYFRDHTSEELTTAMLPIVRKATANAGVTRSYKRMLDKAGALGEALGGNVDLDEYVTDKTLDGLFLKLADEERNIRRNPAARSTELLKKVFR
ncbi:MAG: hypothetical protein CALGDGBN_02934 [Pseudomonadales bacterium]|nr:hypothetical protein [Pseudomonadales bacterium]